jgi:phosphoserine phosphatase
MEWRRFQTLSEIQRLKFNDEGTVKSVYFVRHGMTEWNLERRLQGHRDSPLSEQGREQARHVARALKPLELRRTFVSPLGRARQTAEILCEQNSLELEFCDDLREVSFGQLEGNTLDELERRFPGAWEARTNDKWGYRPPGGEANADAVHRAQRMAERIELLGDDEPILVVAHFAINRLILCELAEIGPDDCMRMNVPHGVVYRARKQADDEAWALAYLDATQDEASFQPGWIEQ